MDGEKPALVPWLAPIDMLSSISCSEAEVVTTALCSSADLCDNSSVSLEGWARSDESSEYFEGTQKDVDGLAGGLFGTSSPSESDVKTNFCHKLFSSKPVFGFLTSRASIEAGFTGFSLIRSWFPLREPA